MCVCICVYMCVVEGKTSKYTNLQSLQVSGLLNPFTAVEATWRSAFGRHFSVLKKKKKIYYPYKVPIFFALYVAMT